MITGIRGELIRVLEDEVRIELSTGLEYQVLVPEIVRRALQMKIGERITLHTIEFLDGNLTRGKVTPRLVGFSSEPEIEFFELFCTVDGIGVKKALSAMVRSVRDVADLIQRQDVAGLAQLPGISSNLAEQVVAKLRRKVTKFALMVDRGREGVAESVASDVVRDAYLALVSVGHSETEARQHLDRVMAQGKKFKTSADLLLAVYERQTG